MIIFRFHDYPLIFPAIHFNNYGFFESDMPQIFRFVNGGQLIQIINIVAAVFLKWIDGEIRNAERSQVLEKVCALTRIDAVVG